MKWLLAVLIAVFLTLQYRLWVGEGSYAHRARLVQEIERQQIENERLRDRNRVLAVEVENLKNGLDVIEERARSDMGMIKEGETFFMTQKEQ
ncbi:septum formation initiator family protein [Gilvimarinus sp. DA14]|uniref:septum formation initiator family protein n=1 Tax=Gilvimarinus sp. DA14 TaxID=2956798 RepID=UPI0020B81AF1|nr:septum formation initiator family protein [Gilvimarinus sp. DA14]UTF60134.1 septum formation initiator family protein [Gilvimarinus sp. DA14]